MLDPPGVRALLLDMDGLMVDSEPLWFAVEREFVRARGGTEFTVELPLAAEEVQGARASSG